MTPLGTAAHVCDAENGEERKLLYTEKHHQRKTSSDAKKSTTAAEMAALLAVRGQPLFFVACVSLSELTKEGERRTVHVERRRKRMSNLRAQIFKEELPRRESPNWFGTSAQ